jgi:hypothetical protein
MGAAVSLYGPTGLNFAFAAESLCSAICIWERADRLRGDDSRSFLVWADLQSGPNHPCLPMTEALGYPSVTIGAFTERT